MEVARITRGSIDLYGIAHLQENRKMQIGILLGGVNELWLLHHWNKGGLGLKIVGNYRWPSNAWGDAIDSRSDIAPKSPPLLTFPRQKEFTWEKFAPIRTFVAALVYEKFAQSRVKIKIVL